MSYITESDIRVKSYDHSNLSRACVVQLRASRWVMSANRKSFEKLWPFEFGECFRCSISSVSIFYVLESDIRVKCYDHSNLSRASVVQFRASRWVMSAKRTSCEKLWPFEFLECFRISISSVSIYYVVESDIRVKYYHHSNLSRAFVVQFRESRYIMSPNRTSEWNFMTIRISRELPLFNFERLDELCLRIGHPSEMLWPFEYLESFRCSISSV